MKINVGDCVRVDYSANDAIFSSYHWTGICTWTDGYKFQFLIDGELDTWTGADLDTVGAEVVSENR